MFRSQSFDHHQGLVTVLVQITTCQRACLVVLQYVAVCRLYVYTCNVPARVVSDYIIKHNTGLPHRTPLCGCMSSVRVYLRCTCPCCE